MDSTPEMKDLLRHKIQGLIDCYQNGRTFGFITKLEETCVMMQQLSQITDIGDALDCVEQAVAFAHQDLMSSASASGASMPLEQGCRGRPRHVIQESVLRYLVESNFTVNDMSMLLMASPSTIKRRLRQYGIRIGQAYSTISQRN